MTLTDDERVRKAPDSGRSAPGLAPVAKPVGLHRVRRVCAMGSAFALFGLGAVALGLLALPVVLFEARFRGREEAATLRIQRWISGIFRLFTRYLELVGIITLEVRGRERLQESGVIVVANHPTLIDVVLLCSVLPQADCVVKEEAFHNPFMRTVIRLAGYIPNSGGERWIGECADRVGVGRRLLLFPEGTRSPFRGLGPFQRGAAHLALATGRPLLPVLIRCEPPGLMRGQKWYDVADRPMAFVLEVEELIEVQALDDEARAGEGIPRRGGASRVLNAMLRDYFEKRLGHVVA